MAIPDNKQQEIRGLLKDWDSGNNKRSKISGMVKPTAPQKAEIIKALQSYWNNPDYNIPDSIDGRLRHGYESRVIRDGFTSNDYLGWLISAGSDNSKVSLDYNGRPLLQNIFNKEYPVLMPIRSDIKGNVFVDGVIPKGKWKK